MLKISLEKSQRRNTRHNCRFFNPILNQDICSVTNYALIELLIIKEILHNDAVRKDFANQFFTHFVLGNTSVLLHEAHCGHYHFDTSTAWLLFGRKFQVTNHSRNLTFISILLLDYICFVTNMLRKLGDC